jgi:hypothetical protein
MAYQLTLVEHPTYLHGRVTGERTGANALRFLTEMHEESVKRGITSVLIEIAFTGPSLDTGTIFSVISERSPFGAKLRKIAYVDTTDPDPRKVEFAETVALNRGVNARLFGSLEAARRWVAS